MFQHFINMENILDIIPMEEKKWRQNFQMIN
jgi:hypothetical protein